MKALNEVAESYFNTLNPIAERISIDILAIKEAYEDLWNSLSVKEQNQIINETVVHPEAILKYTLSSKPYPPNNNVPLQTNATGSKYVVDENTGLSWRDEHSAPFSWKTPSQIDLTVFTSSSGDIHTTDGSFIVNNISSKTQIEATDCLELDKSFKIKLEEPWPKVQSKSDVKKNSLSPESSNVLLVGTCSKLSGFCSKFKFTPSKSYSYEVQTVVSNPAASQDVSFLDKIKSSAAFKLQNTLKFVGSKIMEKKSTENNETQNLVQLKAPTVVRINKPSPKISKPKSPPPPPPILSLPIKLTENSKIGSVNDEDREKNCNEEAYTDHDFEKVTLLENQSNFSSHYLDLDKNEETHSRVDHEISQEFNSLSTEYTPLSGPSTDVIPKSGFDFLDNW